MNEELEGKRVLVLGLGKTGRSVAEFCVGAGARVTAADERDRSQLAGLSDLDAAVELRVGEPFPSVADFDLVIPSPGVPPQRYAALATTVWGDIELAYHALRVPVVAVTGTNGKSTTVRMIEDMLRATGRRAEAAGNLGVPALELVGKALDVAVLEVSSFQLECVEQFAPRVAVILNITPDHLDRHGSFEAYVAAKRRILEQQTETDAAVLNMDDPAVRGLAESTRGRVFGFGIGAASMSGPAAWLDGESVVLRDGAGLQRIALDGLRDLAGPNAQNALAAIAAVWALGVEPEKAATALLRFQGLPHRCEVVATRSGVTYIDDSKATNVGAAIQSLESLPGAILWIAGGSDKDLDFRPLAEIARRRVRKAFLIGETADRIAEALEGSVSFAVSQTLATAVEQAAAEARPGESVLLCPACASFDQFANFEERGERFRESVAALNAGDPS